MDGQIIQIFITALLAAFGALARLLSQKEKMSERVAGMVSGCLVAAFTGVMAYFVSTYFDLVTSLTYILAGISGWIGPKILDVVADFILNKTGLTVRANDNAEGAGGNGSVNAPAPVNTPAAFPAPYAQGADADYYYPQYADIPSSYDDSENGYGDAGGSGYQGYTAYPAS